MREVFIIGSKGIPARYGGFESFVEQLTARKSSSQIHYNVACRRDLSENKSDFYEHNGACCFNVDVPKVGAAKAIMYDVRAFKQAMKMIEERSIRRPIVYVLACRIGPFIHQLKKKLKEVDGSLFVNPDGHEWLRAKWSWPVRRYWKISEKLMVRYADLLICDSRNIEKYIKNDYVRYSPKTTFIAYGSDPVNSSLTTSDNQVKSWFKKNAVELNNYFLIVGRFVPENNYKVMIREFLNSKTHKDLVIISNVEKNKFYQQLSKETGFEYDDRIKFVGTVYDVNLLKFIRENAFAYLHGHEVGGTNPSLLEALSSTKLNLLLDVGFNREVGKTSAFYWNKQIGNLASLISKCENLSSDEIEDMGILSSRQVEKYYGWKKIVSEYELTFLR
ncbi:MAG: DUF1972 domain-containing protein [Levilactobacillus sp.]|jgi:rhamnosyltransferase|uniref:beta 1-4 rhamnosyltransferase Cps2T n=1 Tax=Levilactobacillus sp. TaxID=2767919 RepID=UPI00258B7BE7|nr:DUF1972 domain-containing protein [Levilactobacillus sp.]MCH4123825.1 DUF1972 domain-containing protein [Levilactobacillus sp.]MCI1553923.1 DUF1972 domain-containing protein [Levilactobacillus sp.]